MNIMNCEWNGKPPSKELLRYLYRISKTRPFESEDELIRHFYTYPQTLLDSYKDKVLVVIDYVQGNYFWELKGWYLLDETLYERLNRDNPSLCFITSDENHWSIHWTKTMETFDHSACETNPLAHIDDEPLVSRVLTDPQDIAEYIHTTDTDNLEDYVFFALEDYLTPT